MIYLYIVSVNGGFKEQHSAARRLLFGMLSDIYGINAREEDISFEKRGKPYFKNIPVSFSISHCKGYAACGTIPSSEGSIGIDCECTRPYKEPVAKRVFTESEHREILASADRDAVFTRMWTLKESYVKYTGTGIAGHTKDAEFTLRNGKAEISLPLYAENILLPCGLSVSLCTDRMSEIIVNDIRNCT